MVTPDKDMPANGRQNEGKVSSCYQDINIIRLHNKSSIEENFKIIQQEKIGKKYTIRRPGYDDF